jgi:hypothetical protein
MHATETVRVLLVRMRWNLEGTRDVAFKIRMIRSFSTEWALKENNDVIKCSQPDR